MAATTSRASAVGKLVSRLALGSFVTVLLVLPNVGDRTSPSASAVVPPPCATTTTVDPLATTTTDPLATTTTTDPLATTTTTIDPCSTTTTTTTTSAPTTTAPEATTTAPVATTTTTGAVIPLVPTTTVDPNSVTTTVDPSATTTTVTPPTTTPAGASSTTVAPSSVTTPTIAFDPQPDPNKPIEQLTPAPAVTTTTTVAPTSSTVAPAATTTVVPNAGAPAGPANEVPIGTQEAVKTTWSGDTSNLSADQQKENIEVASYIVKDLFVASNQPLPTGPVAVDGRLTIEGTPTEVKGIVRGTSSGFGPGATGHLYAASQPVHLGAFTADAQGVIHFDVTVPSKLTGAHHLVMVGNDTAGNVKASVLPITIIGGTSGPAASDVAAASEPAVNAAAVTTVEPESDPNQMAMTGADVFGLLFAAVVFIVGGALTTYRLRTVRART